MIFIYRNNLNWVYSVPVHISIFRVVIYVQELCTGLTRLLPGALRSFLGGDHHHCSWKQKWEGVGVICLAALIDQLRN